MADTKGLLILPKTWKKLRKEILSENLSYMSDIMKFALVRQKSGDPGERRHIDVDLISSLILLESHTRQKRWYRCLVSYKGWAQREEGCPQSEVLYFFAHPWILERLLLKAELMAQQAPGKK